MVGRIVWTVAIGLFVLIGIANRQGDQVTPAADKPVAVPASSSAPKITTFLTAKADVASNGAIHIKGQTSLPDGAPLTIQATNAQGTLLGLDLGPQIKSGTFDSTVTLEKQADGEVTVSIIVPSLPSQPDALKSLAAGSRDRVKAALPEGFTLDPKYEKGPVARMDLKVAISAAAKVPADRHDKVLADAKRIATFDVQAEALTQKAKEIWGTYYGQDNAKGKALIEPVFNDLLHVMDQLDGSAKNNLAPEVLPYEDALGAEVMHKVNGVSKWMDSFGGDSKAGQEAVKEFLAAGTATQTAYDALNSLAAKLDVPVVTLMAR